jgi:hypothetical protein
VSGSFSPAVETPDRDVDLPGPRLPGGVGSEFMNEGAGPLVETKPPRREASLALPAFLLFGSVSLVMNLSVASHELGHFIADRLIGVDARMVVEPFRSSYIELREPFPDDLMGWPDAAGPLANVFIGGLLLALLWRRRRAILLPLMLWGPIALVQESTTALVQLGTVEAGSDFVRITAAGVPEPLLMAGAALGLLGGLALLVTLIPVSGMPHEVPGWSRLAVLSTGMGGYLLLSLLVSMALGYEAADIARNGRLLGFVLLLAGMIAAAYRPPLTRRLTSPSVVSSRDVWIVSTTATVVVVIFLAV